jgi:hypothetical protein
MTIRNLHDFFQLCLEAGLFSQEEHDLLSLSISSRGKNKGRIRATIPAKSSPKARGSWQGIVSNCNSNRVVVGSLLLGREEERASFLKTKKILIETFTEKGIGLILSYLEPLRWNVDFPIFDHSDEQKTKRLGAIVKHLVLIKELNRTLKDNRKKHKLNDS